MISTKLQSNFFEIALWHGCSPINLLHIFRTTFPKNTAGRLLVEIVDQQDQNQRFSLSQTFGTPWAELKPVQNLISDFAEWKEVVVTNFISGIKN